ncbi:MAG: SH3 domain-containing protein [Gemmatimonadota bacterium]|nr:SH3 domain-containing protein [Gemmatimonadota bacterium]
MHHPARTGTARRPFARLVALLVVRLALLLALIVSAGWRATLGAQPSPTAILDRLRADTRRPIDFHAAAYPDTVYVGQQVTYQVAVLLSESARSRLRRNPEFIPPELRGLLAYELGTPRRVAPRAYGGGTFEAHVFQRALFAVAPGTVVVPAPQLSYGLPQSSSYFSREEQFVVRAESAQLVVKALPSEGRPSEFTGAVGVLRASLRLDTASARVGDPLVLTMRVDGSGNVKLLPRPLLEVAWASAVPGTERVRIDTSGALVRGYKEFDWILTPAQSGRVELPILRYSYFNPYRGEYAYAETAPGTIAVNDGVLAAAVEGDNVAAVPLRPWRGPDAISLAQRLRAWRTPLLALLLLSPLPWLLLWLRTRLRTRRPQQASASDTGRVAVRDAAARHPAGHPTRADAGDHARQTRRTLLAALAQRLQVAPQALVSRREVERTLRRRGVTRTTTQALLTLLDALAEQGFSEHASRDVPASGNGARAAQAESQADALLARIDAEAVTHGRRIRPMLRSPGGVLLFAAAGLTAFSAYATPAYATPAYATPASAQPAGVDTLVAQAVAGYDRHQYARAAELFAMAVQERPDDADLLANWGAAAWAAGDTVVTVIAWQRAARLQPLAVDLQEHLAALPAGARDGVAAVPMLPVAPLVIGALIAWLLGWTLLASASASARAWATGARTAGRFALVLAVAGGGFALWGARQLDATDLLVVRRPDTMRTAPDTDADAIGGVSTGDVVRLERTGRASTPADVARNGWLPVRHADGRRGWIPATRTVPLVPPIAIR